MMSSVLQITTEAQECGDLSVAMADSQLLSNSLLSYITKSHLSASFMWPCGWLPYPTMGCEHSDVLLPAQDFFQLQKPSGC